MEPRFVMCVRYKKKPCNNREVENKKKQNYRERDSCERNKERIKARLNVAT
jgi:hypothetical protein